MNTVILRCALLAASAVVLVSCASIQPPKRSAVSFYVLGTAREVERATLFSSERLGGTLLRRADVTPTETERPEHARNMHGFVGFSLATLGPVFDTVFYFPVQFDSTHRKKHRDTVLTEDEQMALRRHFPEYSMVSEAGTSKRAGAGAPEESFDSVIVAVHGYFPMLTAAAIVQEFQRQRPEIRMRPGLERNEHPMTSKSSLIGATLMLINPAFGNAYLFWGNPFSDGLRLLPRYLVPLAFDAGVVASYKYRNTRTGNVVFVALAIGAGLMRLVNATIVAPEVERFNLLVSSGYDFSSTMMEQMSPRITVTLPLQ